MCRAGAGIGRCHNSAGRRPVVVGHTCNRLLGLTYDARYTTLLESETSMRKLIGGRCGHDDLAAGGALQRRALHAHHSLLGSLKQLASRIENSDTKQKTHGGRGSHDELAAGGLQRRAHGQLPGQAAAHGADAEHAALVASARRLALQAHVAVAALRQCGACIKQGFPPCVAVYLKLKGFGCVNRVRCLALCSCQDAALRPHGAAPAQ